MHSGFGANPKSLQNFPLFQKAIIAYVVKNNVVEQFEAVLGKTRRTEF